MGKSNRIRNQRVEEKYSSSLKGQKKKGMPSWLISLIAIVITAAVLLTVVMGMLSSSGIIMRMRTAVYSDNYKINGNMMTYLYRTQYINFYNTYSSYMSYFSLDTSKSFKDQKYGEAKEGGQALEASFLGAFDGTWFDYFMSLAKEQATQILTYCEEADTRGITLDKDDKAEIDEAIKTLEETASSSGYTVNSYLANMYGKGVKISDVRKAMELSSLASKCASAIEKELGEAVTESDINTRYDSDKDKYNFVDYDYYLIKVVYDDIAEELLGADYTDAQLEAEKDNVLAKYREKIAAAKEITEKLKAQTSVADFEKVMYATLASDYYDTKFSAAGLSDEEKPDETVLQAVKDAMIDKLVEEIMSSAGETTGDSSETDGTYTIYGQTVSSAAATAFDSIKKDVFESLLKDKSTYILEKQSFKEDDDFSEWAFGDGRFVNETHTIYTGDGSDEAAEITNSDGHFYAYAYIITKPEYRDETLTRNVSYMIFSSEDDAKEAIEAFVNGGTFTAEAFEKVAEGAENVAGSGSYKNYQKGEMGYDEFDEWLYSDERVTGDYTSAPVKLGSSYYALMFYSGEGDAAWYNNVYDTILSERYETYYKNMTAKYTVTAKDKVINKVDD